MKKIEASHSRLDSTANVGLMSSLLKKGFSLILVLIVILASVNIFQLQKIKRQLNTLVSTNIEKMALGAIMRDSIRLRTISMYKMLETEDYFERDDEIAKFYSYAKKYREARNKTDYLGVTKIEKELDEKIIEQINIAQPLAREAVNSMLSNLTSTELRNKVTNAIKNQDKLYSLLNELNSLQENQSKQTLKDVDKNFTYIILLTLVVTIVVIFLSLQIAIRLYNHVINTSNVLAHKNIDLKDAYIKAEESTKIKSEFLAKMSHEIRTPMNGVMGMLQLLLEDGLNAEQKDYAETALNSSKSLLTIINDILDFSKMEAGKLDIENIPFSISTTIEDVISTVANSAQQKHLELKYLINPDVEKYYIGDASRISQILINLIGNAIKFTDKGEVEVNLSIKESDSSFSLLHFEVSDSGIGITDEAKKNLFTSFNQADNSISRNYGGTGLGLAICKQLCSLMGGSIGIYDGVNGGSVFWFTLKLARAKEQQDEISNINLQEENIEQVILPQEKQRLTNKRILIVEDKEVNQRVASKILERLNYLSDIANNGKMAIEKTQLINYDLILMDCHMPNMDGFEATQKIRKLQKGGSIPFCPIIALTGNAMLGDKEKCIEAGMDDFLAKPFTIDELSNIMEKWLQKST